MKKLISLCAFLFVFALGTQTADAQKEKNIEEQAKLESLELQKVLGLDDNQTALVWRALMVKEKSNLELAQKGVLNAEDKKKYTYKMEMNYKEQLLSILNEEQFAKYSAYLAEQKTKQ